MQDALDKAKQELQATKDSAEQELAMKDSKIAELQKLNEEHAAARHESEQAAYEAQSEAGKARSQTQERYEALIHEQNVSQTLRDQITGLKAAHAIAMSNLTVQHNEELSRVRSDLHTTKLALYAQENNTGDEVMPDVDNVEPDQLQAQNNELMSDNSRLRSENARLEQEAVRVCQYAEQLESRNEQLVNENRELNDQSATEDLNRELRYEKMEALRNENKELQVKLAGFQTDISYQMPTAELRYEQEGMSAAEEDDEPQTKGDRKRRSGAGMPQRSQPRQHGRKSTNGRGIRKRQAKEEHSSTTRLKKQDARERQAKARKKEEEAEAEARNREAEDWDEPDEDEQDKIDARMQTAFRLQAAGKYDKIRAKYPIGELIHNGNQDTAIYFSEHKGNRMIMAGIKIDEFFLDQRQYILPLEEGLSTREQYEHRTQMCVLAHYPEVHLEAAQLAYDLGMLGKVSLEGFKARFLQERGTPPECPEKNWSMKAAWKAVVGELADLENFNDAARAWARGEESKSGWCWPPTFFDSETQAEAMLPNDSFDGPLPEDELDDLCKRMTDKTFLGACSMKMLEDSFEAASSMFNSVSVTSSILTSCSRFR